MDNRKQLGDFLRRRREKLSPADVGLPGGGRRRTPGLRRDEVAALAYMSAVYYERLEQGRGPVPSATVLAGLAAALRLTTDERDHMYTLAGLASPAPSGDGDGVDPGLEYVLRAVAETTPASVTDELSTVVAQNWLNQELFGEFTGLPGHGSNLIWRWFTSAEWRHYLEPAGQHEDASQFYVADLRATIARRGHDPEAIALVDDLRLVSKEFARIWDQHSVSVLYCTPKAINEARVGRLDLDCTVVTSPLSRQRLLLLRPVAGTPATDRLERLAGYRLAAYQ